MRPELPGERGLGLKRSTKGLGGGKLGNGVSDVSYRLVTALIVALAAANRYARLPVCRALDSPLTPPAPSEENTLESP